MHTSVRRIAIAALALPLLLAGCADDEPVPKTAEPTTPATSVTETVETNEPGEPIEPTLPPEAEGKGRKAAEAFIRHYYDTVNYAQATGDTMGLRALALRSCAACEGGADAIDRVSKQGGTINGGEYTVTATRAVGRQDFSGAASLYYFRVSVVSATQEVTGTKDLDGDYGGGRTRLRFQVASSDIGLQVAEWSTL